MNINQLKGEILSNNRFTTILQLGLVGAALCVGGCATVATSNATSKFQPLTDDVLQQHKGDVLGLYNAWIKPQTQVARTPGDAGPQDVMPPTMDFATMEATEAAIVKDFQRFCEASGGTVDPQPRLYGANVCKDASGAYVGEIDTRHLSVETDPPQWGLIFYEGSRQQREQSTQEDARAKAAIRRDNYALLTPEKLSTLDQSTLTRLIKDFEGDDPKNRLPRAKARLAALQAEAAKQAAERNRVRLAQLQAAQAARRSAQESRQIGDQVCFVSNNTAMSQPTGMVVLGEEQYREVRGTTRAVGFIEGINRGNGKIQIRISGITFTASGRSDSMDSWSNFKNGITLRINGVIWDDMYDWDGC